MPILRSHGRHSGSEEGEVSAGQIQVTQVVNGSAECVFLPVILHDISDATHSLGVVDQPEEIRVRIPARTATTTE